MSQVREILDKSTLAVAEKSLLAMYIEKDAEMTKFFVENFSEHPEEVAQFYANVKEKVDAAGNPDALSSIYAKEKAAVEKMIADANGEAQ